MMQARRESNDSLESTVDFAQIELEARNRHAEHAADALQRWVGDLRLVLGELQKA